MEARNLRTALKLGAVALALFLLSFMGFIG